MYIFEDEFSCCWPSMGSLNSICLGCIYMFTRISSCFASFFMPICKGSPIYYICTHRHMYKYVCKCTCICIYIYIFICKCTIYTHTAGECGVRSRKEIKYVVWFLETNGISMGRLCPKICFYLIGWYEYWV